MQLLSWWFQDVYQFLRVGSGWLHSWIVLVSGRNFIIRRHQFVRNTSGTRGDPWRLRDPQLLCSACVAFPTLTTFHHSVGPVNWVSCFWVLDRHLALLVFVQLFSSIQVNWRGAPVGLCEIFNISPQRRCSSFALHSFAFVRHFFLLSNACQWSLFHCCLPEGELFFICDIWGGSCHLSGFSLYVFPDFEMELLSNSGLQSVEKVSWCVARPGGVWFLKIELQLIITCIPERRWACLPLKEIDDPFVISQDSY